MRKILLARGRFFTSSVRNPTVPALPPRISSVSPRPFSSAPPARDLPPRLRLLFWRDTDLIVGMKPASIPATPSSYPASLLRPGHVVSLNTRTASGHAGPRARQRRRRRRIGGGRLVCSLLRSVGGPRLGRAGCLAGHRFLFRHHRGCRLSLCRR